MARIIVLDAGPLGTIVSRLTLTAVPGYAELGEPKGVSTRRSHMATNASTTRPGSTAIDMLEQLAELDARSLSPDTARKLLQFEFDGAQKARVTILSQ